MKDSRDLVSELESAWRAVMDCKQETQYVEVHPIALNWYRLFTHPDTMMFNVGTEPDGVLVPLSASRWPA